MQARDVMTTSVITVTPDTSVGEIARLLLERRISGVPVVDGQGRLQGLVTEGDLMRRSELGTERHRSWWLRLFESPEQSAGAYAKSHGLRARDVMTTNVVTVSEDASLGEIAELLEARRIKRVPVVRAGQVVGIVSRANLLQGLTARAAALGPAPAADDRAVRERVMQEIHRQGWVSHGLNVIVNGGVAELWGFVESGEERRAIRVAVEGVRGVREVKDRLGSVQPWVWGL